MGMSYRDPVKQRTHQAKWIAKRRSDWILANGPCVECGSWDDPQLDHIDRSQKVSHKIWSWSEERFEIEAAKCQVLCRRCHKNKTYSELSKPLVHGTATAYKYRGCRCNDCRVAAREQTYAWQRRIGGRRKKCPGIPGLVSVDSLRSPSEQPVT